MRIVRAALVVAATALAALALGGSSVAADVAAQGSATPAVTPAARTRAAGDLSWKLTPTGRTERFRGLSAVSGSVAWVSGTGGTVLRTTDGGASWASVGPPGTKTLQLRDIEATSAWQAVVLSIGTGDESRIYVTDDGGASWTESFRNPDPKAFYDCMAFSSPQRGVALSDPVDGVLRLLETTDGGRSWAVVNPDGMPAALPNEFAFAASGQCLSAGQGQSVYLGSGGQSPARVFASQNGGHTWSVTEVPVVGAPSAGVFSVRFRDRHTGIAVGGDYANPTAAIGTAAWTADGLTWQPATPTPTGYRSGSAWLPHDHTTAVAVGPGGSDVSSDEGRRWTPFDTGAFDSVDCAPDGGCWASGEHGRVARLVVARH
jgi:photosystem II stability/assembly factor-like uncharacterized protein